MTRRPPRYDVPKAAPPPLRLVQEFVNSVDLENGREWLGDWLRGQGVRASAADLGRATRAREALRELLQANNGESPHGDPWSLLSGVAAAAELTVDFAGPTLRPRAPGLDGVLGQVVAVAFTAMVDGSWARLKACRNHRCGWAFYDHSKNRSASWCSMQLCGNRAKLRAHRERKRSAR